MLYMPASREAQKNNVFNPLSINPGIEINLKHWRIKIHHWKYFFIKMAYFVECTFTSVI